MSVVISMPLSSSFNFIVVVNCNDSDIYTNILLGIRKMCVYKKSRRRIKCSRAHTAAAGDPNTQNIQSFQSRIDCRFVHSIKQTQKYPVIFTNRKNDFI